MDYIHLPIADMREEPNAGSKVVSQALFGERVEVRERKGDWVSIITPDHYRGWVQEHSLICRDEPYPEDVEVTRLRAHIYGVPDTEYGPLMTLPHGSKLHTIDSSDSRWVQIRLPDLREGFIQKGDVTPQPFELVAFSKQFLGLPYTWGGRSSFGFDCSGFVQMVYRQMGVALPRDAREQILSHLGKRVSFEKIALGDLIFWGKSEREIKHVGMSLGGEEFIHSSSRENMPYLRISKLSDFEWSGHRDASYPFRSAYTFSAQSSPLCCDRA